MKRTFGIFVLLLSLSLVGSHHAFSDTCGSCPPPPSSTPGGDHPDETFAVDSGFIGTGNTMFNSDPTGVTFQNGYFQELSGFFNAFKKGETRTDGLSPSLALLTSSPLFVIPSGGLYGLENSTFFKATLGKYRDTSHIFLDLTFYRKWATFLNMQNKRNTGSVPTFLGYKPIFLERYGGRLRGGVKDTRKTVFELKALKTEEDYYDGYYHTSWTSVGYDRHFQIDFASRHRVSGLHT